MDQWRLGSLCHGLESSADGAGPGSIGGSWFSSPTNRTIEPPDGARVMARCFFDIRGKAATAPSASSEFRELLQRRKTPCHGAKISCASYPRQYNQSTAFACCGSSPLAWLGLRWIASDGAQRSASSCRIIVCCIVVCRIIVSRTAAGRDTKRKCKKQAAPRCKKQT